MFTGMTHERAYARRAPPVPPPCLRSARRSSCSMWCMEICTGVGALAYAQRQKMGRRRGHPDAHARAPCSAATRRRSCSSICAPHPCATPRRLDERVHACRAVGAEPGPGACEGCTHDVARHTRAHARGPRTGAALAQHASRETGAAAAPVGVFALVLLEMLERLVHQRRGQRLVHRALVLLHVFALLRTWRV